MRALNRIPIVFAGNKSVMNAYFKFREVLHTNDKDLRDDALITLVKEMCKDVKINTDWNDSYFKNAFIIL